MRPHGLADASAGARPRSAGGGELLSIDVPRLVRDVKKAVAGLSRRIGKLWSKGNKRERAGRPTGSHDLPQRQFSFMIASQC
jgi:hypothetical protein